MALEIQGLEEVVDTLETMASNSTLEQALMDACMLVEGEAKEKAPKGKTGDLRRFITSKIEGDKGIIYSPLEYAPYVEYGTGLYAESGGRTDVPWAYEDEETGELIWTAGQHPQPFLRPALDENRQEIVRILREGIAKK